MSTVAKVLVVLNLILAVAFVASASSYLGQQDHWKAKFDGKVTELATQKATYEKQLELERADKAKVSAQANAALAAKEAAEATATALTGEANMLREAIRQAGGTATANSRALEAAQGTITALQGQVAQLQQVRQDLTNNLAAANKARDDAEKEANKNQVAITNLTAEKQALEGRLAEVQQELDRAEFQLAAYKEKFRDADVPTAQPSHQGRVLAVDADTNVVIISLGSEDGVKEGFEYRVSRGAAYVGRITITSVESKKSAGRSMLDVQSKPIEAGDTVVSR
jgi:uncharacterized phage infection (PIP) family protein YhgE